jgi:hypothetical protein
LTDKEFKLLGLFGGGYFIKIIRYKLGFSAIIKTFIILLKKRIAIVRIKTLVRIVKGEKKL